MPYTPQQVQQMVSSLLARLGRPAITVGARWGLEGCRVSLYRGKVSIPVCPRGPAGPRDLARAIDRYGQGDEGPLRQIVEDAVRELEEAEKSSGSQGT